MNIYGNRSIILTEEIPPRGELRQGLAVGFYGPALHIKPTPEIKKGYNIVHPQYR